MEEALYNTALIRRFADINNLVQIPDETTTLNFLRLAVAHGLGTEILEARRLPDIE